MNIKKYINEAIDLHPAFGQKDMTQVAGLDVRWGFPEPGPSVTLIVGQRGNADNGIDVAYELLRDYVEQLISRVVEDCISSVQEEQTISDECKKSVARAIQDHFEIVVH